jgi:hypothetical protein
MRQHNSFGGMGFPLSLCKILGKQSDYPRPGFITIAQAKASFSPKSCGWRANC